MANVSINEVHTEVEVTESVGALEPSEIKKLVSIVMEHLKADQYGQEMRRRDDGLHDRAYSSDRNT